MTSLDDIPFDLDSTESDAQDRVEGILDELGFESWRDVFIEWETVAPEYLRGHRYLTAEEGLFDLHKRGIIRFTKLVYFPSDGTYSLAVVYVP
jgi:hypothetical protein